MKKYLLGIDVGTTGTKTLLFTTEGEVVSRAYRDYALSTPVVGYSEQDANDWWKAIVETVREVCADKEISKNVLAISLSTQGGTIVPTDAAANPLCPAIVWNDGRCKAQREKFADEIGADYMYRATGWHLGNNLPALSIRWIKDNKPEIFEKASLFLSVPDFVSMKMTGIAAIDLSNAGINQLCDIKKEKYDEKLLSFAGISEKNLPKLVCSGEVIGNLTDAAADELGLMSDTVLVAGAHDQYAVAAGAGASNAGDILIGSGTCWVVTAISDEPDFKSGLSQSVCATKGKWGSLQSLSSGGVCLDWLRKNVCDKDILSYKVIDGETSKRKAAEDDLFFYPFSGKSDENSSFSRASFVGMDLSHDRLDLALAVMEGIVFQILWMMESFSAKPSDEGIILAGGASKSPVWSQLLADISGLNVRIPDVADLSCVGAAIMAGVGCGVYSDEKVGYRKLSVKESVIKPDLTRTEIFKPIFEKYKQQAKLLAK